MPMLMPAVANASQRRRFCLILVKPTHYDDDGYVIQWFRSAIPSNSLACIYGLARDLADQRVLGEDVDFEIHAFDESNTRIRPQRLARLIRAADAGMVMLVGVQSNQTPRALDIARPLREMGIQVGIGGFHMAGVLAMVGGDDAALREAQAMGLSIFAGEAEDGRLEAVLRDAYAGTLKPLYNFMNDLPGIEGVPIPFLGRDRVSRTAGAVTSFDAGRGCPYQCSFCTIINVQGRVSRRRSPDDVEMIVRENIAQGLSRFFITDDNFARNSQWEALFDRMIELREKEGLKLKLVIQVDTLCHRIPNFISKARRAGVKRVFIGLENINPDNLLAAKKRQNKITEYRLMLQQWRAQSITTYAGYILGFPNDTKASILRDIEIIKKELPVDLLEFFFLTPLPGSEDHKTLLAKNVWMDGDLNKYDLNHRVTHHPRMSDAEWEAAYREAWASFYSADHVETVLRRAAAQPDGRPHSKASVMLWFYLMHLIEGLHPLEGGIFRFKYRRDRRPGLPIESPLVFYSKYAAEVASKLYRYGSMIWRFHSIYRKVMRDPARASYTDLAITPPREDELETLSLFRDTAGGEAAVARKRAADDLRVQFPRLQAAE
jgi:hypothetical protein